MQRQFPGWVDFSPVARSPPAEGGDASLVGGKFDGCLSLYRFPCTEVEVAMVKQYPAHGGPVAFLCFICGEEWDEKRWGSDEVGENSHKKEGLRDTAILYSGGMRDRVRQVP